MQKTLLLMKYDERLTQSLKRFLYQSFTPHEATNVEEIIAFLKKLTPGDIENVVVLVEAQQIVDNRLENTGIKLMTRLRCGLDYPLSAVPVMLMSCESRSDLKKQAVGTDLLILDSQSYSFFHFYEGKIVRDLGAQILSGSLLEKCEIQSIRQQLLKTAIRDFRHEFDNNRIHPIFLKKFTHTSTACDLRGAVSEINGKLPKLKNLLSRYQHLFHDTISTMCDAIKNIETRVDLFPDESADIGPCQVGLAKEILSELDKIDVAAKSLGDSKLKQ